jgi:hypothetical protein
MDWGLLVYCGFMGGVGVVGCWGGGMILGCGLFLVWVVWGLFGGGGVGLGCGVGGGVWGWGCLCFRGGVVGFVLIGEEVVLMLGLDGGF